MNRKNNDCGRISCKCQKSKCLKLYCNCFQQNLLCTYSCQCHDCENTETYSGPGGARTMAVEEVINRRPDAFSPRSSDGGCNCKKNKCLKKYCVSLNFFCYFGIRLLCISQLVLLLHSQICFNQSLKCDDKCRCKDCQNQATSKEEDLHIKVEPIPNDQKCIQERGTNAAPYKSWDKRLEQLRQHFETHGHCTDSSAERNIHGSILIRPEEYVEDEIRRLGKSNGNHYVRKAGVDGVHNGQIMIRLKSKRYIIIDYTPSEYDHELVQHHSHISIPPGAGQTLCKTVDCPRVGVPGRL